ncbi:hypothetical protein AVEN_52434-1 [Araneus ventricosus]|uniref:Granulins domain-containing protein n=1 Tax=Araneus ventricosus TaxID=182803 RepID=A0A4Y2CXC8_ARAVE|nr:hypothetical protein AVEN_52434-1 [Araneus ventricosus]
MTTLQYMPPNQRHSGLAPIWVCCKSWFHYRCCPIKDGGVCCSGGHQCCPKGYECLRLGINNFCVNGTSKTRPGMNSPQTVKISPALFTEDGAEFSV